MNSFTNHPLKLLLVCFLFARTIQAAQTDLAPPGEGSKDRENWQGDLRAGIAKISITPAHAKKPVHDDVKARVLVLEIGGQRVAFVSVDLGVYTSEHLVATCKEKFVLSQVFLSSSHTHSDP